MLHSTRYIQSLPCVLHHLTERKKKGGDHAMFFFFLFSPVIYKLYS